jgi:purine nucleosidase
MDGNNDDFVAFLLLLNFRNVELVGITITPADCDPNSSLEFVTKILHKRGLKVPIVIQMLNQLMIFLMLLSKFQ